MRSVNLWGSRLFYVYQLVRCRLRDLLNARAFHIMTFNICITGAAGHVGKVVSRAALAKGHRVFGVDLQASSGVSESDKYNYKQLDVRDDSALKTAMKEQGCDAMIHLAAALNNHNSVHKGKDWTESVSCGKWVSAMRSRLIRERYIGRIFTTSTRQCRMGFFVLHPNLGSSGWYKPPV